MGDYKNLNFTEIKNKNGYKLNEAYFSTPFISSVVAKYIERFKRVNGRIPTYKELNMLLYGKQTT